MQQAAEQQQHQLPPGSATAGPGREHVNTQAVPPPAA
jgi:vacuolar protein sorting-associated protein 26